MKLENFSCIDLDQPALEGFRQFISCWLYQSRDFCFIVDPGPLSTISLLTEELSKRQVKTLDYILLTHIHIDHAGGTGELIKKYPQAKVICHPKGIPHLVEPEKLWLGSQKVLGKLAETFGEIIPVPQANIGFEEIIGTTGIRSLETPGHAQHHCCYLFNDLLFGGEVAGVHAPVTTGIYMRPATPPQFILEVALDSLQRMIDLAPHYLVIAHYGLVEPAVDYLEISLKQLKLWINGITHLSDSHINLTNSDIFEWLQDNDANFANFPQLPIDIQAREIHFLDNSLRGMFDYIAKRKSTN